MASGPGHFVASVERRSGATHPAAVQEGGLPQAVFWHDRVQLPFVETDTGTGARERIDKGGT